MSRVSNHKVVQDMDIAIKHLDLAIAGMAQIAGTGYMSSLYDFRRLVKLQLRLRNIVESIRYGRW